MMRSLMCPVLSGLWLLSALAFSSPVGAQDIASAEALFNKGVEEMKAGHYETGCKAIGESQRLDPRPGTLFTLATCEKDWGHIATAFVRYGDYISVYERLPESKRAEPVQKARYTEAKEAREKLAPEVPRLTLLLPKDAPVGTVVKRDGEEVAAAMLGLELPVDPGQHVLSIQVPGHGAVEQRVTIRKGEKRSVLLEEQATPEPSASSAPSASAVPASAAPSGWRTATYVIGGVGLAGLVAGGILGGLAVGQKGVLEQHCGAAIGEKDDAACDPTGLDAASSVKGLGNGSTVALAVGGAAVVAAAVLFLIEPKADRPRSGRGSPWVAVGVAPVGPAGAMLGAQGRW